MEVESACLGLDILGKCSYDPANPSSHFTLGNLLSVIALLLAVSQLTRPIIRFRIKAHKLNQSLLIAVVSVAIVSVFIATALPFIPGRAFPLIGYPIFWEFLSALLFVASGAYVVIVISKKVKFSRRNAEEYLNATMAYVAKGGEQLNELADEIFPSIQPVIEEARKFKRIKRGERAKGEDYEASELTKIANTVLYLWSDKNLCKAIVCGSPASAVEVISCLSENPNSNVGRFFCDEIINQSFANRESVLNREESFSGLGFFKNFMRLCFGNWKFVGSSYRPLQSWAHHEGNLEPWKVRKYCECVEMAVEAYLQERECWNDPVALRVALDNMANLAMTPMLDMLTSSDPSVWDSRVGDVLFEVSRSFEKVIRTVSACTDLPTYEFDEREYDAYKDPSIFGVVAKGIYDYFEKLAMMKKHDSQIRHYAIGIWLEIFGVGSSELSDGQNEIGKRLLVHLKKKVDENLDHDQRWYPAITKLLLSLNGIYEDDGKDDRICAIFHREFLEKVKAKFQSLHKAEEDFALDMLPESFVYDEVGNKIIHHGFRKKVTELVLR